MKVPTGEIDSAEYGRLHI